MTRDDLTEALSAGGDFRAYLENQIGPDVLSLLDTITAELEKTHLEDLTLKYGAKRANVAETPDGQVQLNVQWDDSRGWSCYTAETFEEATTLMWSQLNIIQTQKESNRGLQTGND